MSPCLSITGIIIKWIYSLHWRHNDHDGVSDHQPRGCLLNLLFRSRSKKTSKLRVTGLCVGNSPGPVNSPHKWPVTRKMFPFDDVIMVGPSHCSSLIDWVPLDDISFDFHEDISPKTQYWQQVYIGLVNGLAKRKWQAIIWSNDH